MFCFYLKLPDHCKAAVRSHTGTAHLIAVALPQLEERLNEDQPRHCQDGPTLPPSLGCLVGSVSQILILNLILNLILASANKFGQRWEQVWPDDQVASERRHI
jgi:hypothetical protein